MLKVLKSIFGRAANQEKYSEERVSEAIERSIEKIDPWLKTVFDYKYKMRQAVILSLEHAERLVSKLPPPIPIKFDPNGFCSSLAAFFATQGELRKTVQNDREISAFLRANESSSKQITALLLMEKSEKTIFGAELAGEVIVRDVPQTSVTFRSQRFIEPAGSEKETRRKLASRAFDHLLKIAQKRVAATKCIRKDLERRRTLLQAKLSLLQREDWHLDDAESATMPSVAEVMGQLKLIEAQLQEQGSEDKMLNVYLDIAIQILSHPEEHLWETNQNLILDRSGIKRAQRTENSSEFALQELCDSEGRQWITLLVSLSVEELRKFCREDLL